MDSLPLKETTNTTGASHSSTLRTEDSMVFVVSERPWTVSMILWVLIPVPPLE